MKMQVTENRQTPNPPPPVESYTLTVTPEQMRMLRYFAECAACRSFLDTTSHLEAANLPLDWSTRF